ncbi:unnamed protein product [Rangifer tarandus platyrhynchus]|uniref:Uncharacterized protein n=1 Tax=Rangifer tarandus platyrhynchus TaxID=3082113 RepID=A0AC59ZR86_RANTA
MRKIPPPKSSHHSWVAIVSPTLPRDCAKAAGSMLSPGLGHGLSTSALSEGAQDRQALGTCGQRVCLCVSGGGPACIRHRGQRSHFPQLRAPLLKADAVAS